MKKIFLMFCFTYISILGSIAYGEEYPDEICYPNAAKFAENEAQGNYDKNGFKADLCTVANNKKAVICEVFAMKGDGAAFDTYRVVMSRRCSIVFRVEIIGIE